MRALITALALLAACAAAQRPGLIIKDDELILDGKPIQIISGR